MQEKKDRFELRMSSAYKNTPSSAVSDRHNLNVHQQSIGVSVQGVMRNRWRVRAGKESIEAFQSRCKLRGETMITEMIVHRDCRLCVIGIDSCVTISQDFFDTFFVAKKV